METENKIPKKNEIELEVEIVKLKAENQILKAEITKLKEKLVMLGGIDDICPKCRKPQGEFIKKAPSIIFKQFGLKTNFYKCKNCSYEYEKQNRP